MSDIKLTIGPKIPKSTLVPSSDAAPLVPSSTGASAHPAKSIMADPYVMYYDFNPDMLILGKPQSKKSKPTADQPAGVPFFIISVMYNYGTKEAPKIAELKIKGPVDLLTTSTGIVYKVRNGRLEWQLAASLPWREDPEVFKYVDCWNRLHAAIAKYVESVRGDIGKSGFRADMAMAMGLKHPIYCQIDPQTGAWTEGRRPTQYCNLYRRGTPPAEDMTLVQTFSGKVIDWKLLFNASFRFQPTTLVSQVKATALAISITTQTTKVTVYGDVKPRGTASQDADELAYAEQHREEAERIESSIEQIAEIRKDAPSLDEMAKTAVAASVSTSGSSPPVHAQPMAQGMPQGGFSGQIPPGYAQMPGGYPGMPQMPQGYSGYPPQQGVQSNLGDFMRNYQGMPSV